MQKKPYKIAINWIQEPTLGTKLKVAAQIYGKTFVIGEVRSPFQDGVQAMQKRIGMKYCICFLRRKKWQKKFFQMTRQKQL